MITAKRSSGDLAETHVAKELQKDGYTIIARNYQKPYGEIDIIAQKKDVIAFVEVKMRRSNTIPMQEIITPAKQKKIILVAKEYICSHRINNKICRFDAALVFTDTHNHHQLTYIPNAFQEPRR
jgi:putative endonuclease